MLFQGHADELDRLIFKKYLREREFSGIDIGPYEALGDLQGSGLLQSEESLRAACRILAKNAEDHHVKHLEVRCSPVNYTRGGLEAERVVRIIDEEMGASSFFSHALIFIASRHGKMSVVHEHIELAEELLGEQGNGLPSFQGFDLAGKEGILSPASDARGLHAHDGAMHPFHHSRGRDGGREPHMGGRVSPECRTDRARAHA